MKAHFLIVLAFCTSLVGAQDVPKPITFHIELEGAITRSTMLTQSDDFDNRFDFGGGLALLGHKDLTSLLTLMAGIGFQNYSLRQRNLGLVFGCDLPVSLGGDGQRSYVDSKMNLSALTLPLALRIRPNRTQDGVYIDGGVTMAYNIGYETTGSLHECGAEDGTDFPVGSVTANAFTVFPGMSFGYQLEGDNGRTSYVEIGVSTSLGKVLERTENEWINYLEGAGALIGSVTVGWQVGGKDKNKRPKKVAPKPVLGFKNY